MGISEMSKIEFQALIMQLAVQRRFEHVVIATDLYNRLFGDGDNSLSIEEGSDADKMLGQGLGVQPDDHHPQRVRPRGRARRRRGRRCLQGLFPSATS